MWLLLAVGLLALMLPAAADAAAAAKKPVLKSRVLTTTQSSALARKYVRVRVGTRRAGRVRVYASVRYTGFKSRAHKVTGVRTVRFRKRGTKTLKLKLTTAGRKRMDDCRGQRLFGRSFLGRKRGSSSRLLKIDRRGCAAQVLAGNAPGTRGGGGGAGGGGSGSRGSVDLSDADRCDFTDPAVCMFPWPNDRFTKPDSSTTTKRRLNFEHLAMPRNQAQRPIEPTDYNRSDGFSPGNKILTKVPGLESQAAFNRTGLVPITDMARSFDRSQPVVVINTRTLARHLIWAEVDANPKDPANVNLIVRPGVNFDEGTRYIVALRNLREASGKPILAHAGFALYRDRIATNEPQVESRRAHFESIFSTLGRAEIQRDDLYLAWDFTVASRDNISGRLRGIRDDAFAKLGDTNLGDLKVDGAAPSFVVTKQEDFTPEQNSRIARRVEGRFVVPCYMNAPGCPPGSQFAFASLDGNTPTAIPGNQQVTNFICNIPRSAVGVGTVNPARPSLYGHGLLGGASEVNSGAQTAMMNEHNFMYCATDWSGMATEDVPNVGTILLDLSRFPSLTDRVQQGILNFMYLGRLMIHPNGFNAHPAFQFPTLGGLRGAIDTRRLFYDGNSQGGIYGGTLTAVAPDYERAVLGVPGMNYSTLLRRSVDFDEYSVVMYTSYPNELERPLILSLIQLLWDRSDPNGYAHHMTDDPYPNTPRHEVLLHPAFGDHQVAHVAADVEARTVGASTNRPALDPGRSPDVTPLYGIPTITQWPHPGSAIIYWDTGPMRVEGGRTVGTPPPPTTNTPPREGQDPHSAPRSDAEGRVQKARFLSIGGSVFDVCGGRPCYADSWNGP